MCPTGWFVPTADGPGYMTGTLGTTFPIGLAQVPDRHDRVTGARWCQDMTQPSGAPRVGPC